MKLNVITFNAHISVYIMGTRASWRRRLCPAVRGDLVETGQRKVADCLIWAYLYLTVTSIGPMLGNRICGFFLLFYLHGLNMTSFANPWDHIPKWESYIFCVESWDFSPQDPKFPPVRCGHGEKRRVERVHSLLYDSSTN